MQEVKRWMDFTFPRLSLFLGSLRHARVRTFLVSAFRSSVPGLFKGIPWSGREKNGYSWTVKKKKYMSQRNEVHFMNSLENKQLLRRLYDHCAEKHVLLERLFLSFFSLNHQKSWTGNVDENDWSVRFTLWALNITHSILFPHWIQMPTLSSLKPRWFVAMRPACLMGILPSAF